VHTGTGHETVSVFVAEVITSACLTQFPRKGYELATK
jgi:hypothetical protein